MKQLLTILFLAFVCQTIAWGQVEQVHPLTSNPLLRKGPSMVRQRAATDTLQLPFADDFSNKSIYPDPDKWTDNYVFINNTYPLNKISYGVATFDGLNQYGQPYNTDSGRIDETYGGADTLTSKPIDLSGFTSAADSVYLSFAFEPGGLGDYPDLDDSLVLEFSYDDSTWNTVWAQDGYNAQANTPDTFQNVYVLLDDPFYFRKGFRFRFRNYASVIGNNDHWHLDYVYLDAHRTANDPYRTDLCYLDQPENFLKDYTSMPWGQFYNYQATEMADTVNFCLRNYFNAPLSPTIAFDVTELRSGTQLYTYGGGFTLNSLDTRCFQLPVSNFMPFTFTPADTDSVVMSARAYVLPSAGDLYLNNDTVVTNTNFYNYFAYDDGSAERGYGLAGASGLKKFAYQFHLNHPDTLRAVLIHFTKIDFDPSNEIFSFYVWRHIDLANTGNGDDSIYHEDYRKPLYVDSIGGFATFVLDTPILVSDSFYVGFQQIGMNNIEVGLDLNNTAKQHMYYYANSSWFKSQVDGAPMMRPLVGKYVHLIGTGVNEPEKVEEPLLVYPNPAEGQLYASFITNQTDVEAEVYDVSGRLLLRQDYHNLSININTLQNGFYLIRFTRHGEPVSAVARFVKL